MSGVFGYNREAVRVKVQKCEGLLQPEYRRFSVDPQITSFEILQSIIAKAFDLKGDFTVSYRVVDDFGQETYLSLLSDWDLDAAFLRASEPCLGLQIEPKPLEESPEKWEEGDVDVMPSIRGLEALRLPQLQMQQFQGMSSGHSDSMRLRHSIQTQQTQNSSNKVQHRLPGLILNQVERTFNMVQRALNLVEEAPPTQVLSYACRPPLSDGEFRTFRDAIGQVVQDRQLKEVIYSGGIEPSLRKVVWKHILNVYPEGMSGKERIEYMKKKSHEYYGLRDCWRDMTDKGQVTSDLTYVTNMVWKDVLRTDRHLPFYSGSDDNQNITSLSHILITYALNHPEVSYCQGMSDLASPLLVTMGDEAHAYICFCALMRRLHPNFMLDGEAMTLRFQHLSDGLMFYDPEFYAYLKSHQADDLLFCYRWLLLEMKREFAFDNALLMMEVMWSSIPASVHIDPKAELPLFDVQFCAPQSGQTPPPISPLLKTPRENAYTKVCALRRQGSAVSLSCKKQFVRNCNARQNQSLDETGSARVAQRKVKPFCSLDEATLLGRSVSLGDASPSGNGRKSDDSTSSLTPLSPRSPASILRGSTKQHFREKFHSGRCKNLLSLDMLNEHSSTITEESQEKKQENTRMVKNLNEFLNFSNLNSPKKSKTLVSKQEFYDKEDINENGSDSSSLKSYFSDGKSQIERRSNYSLSTTDKTGSDSSPDDSDRYPTTSMYQKSRSDLDGLDKHASGSSRYSAISDDTEDTESACSESGQFETESDTTLSKREEVNKANNGLDDVFLWENPLKSSPITPDEQADLEYDSRPTSLDGPRVQSLKSISPSRTTKTISSENIRNEASKIRPRVSSFEDAKVVHGKKCATEPSVLITSNTNCEEAVELTCMRPLPTGVPTTRLPPPSEFGGGNPFLMFLCLTVLRQHRDYIMRNNLDYNEVAMHFDKMVRKHDVNRVLNQARQMFAVYMKQYNNNSLDSVSNGTGLNV